ncbi:MAG TPA: hypothetical protein VEP90_28315 [Methylomirabilota bacterium]|nr:hypothetical protein [Methylomirabilota bacterium]
MATERFADFGSSDDSPSAPGGPGSINSHLRLATTLLNTIANNGGVGAASGSTISNQGVGNAAGSPWSVSGTVAVTQSTTPWVIDGPTASGTLFVNPPVMVGGADSGGIVRTLLTDSSGRQIVVGAAATGTTTVGINPILIAGKSTGTNLLSVPSIDTNTANNSLFVSINQAGGTAITGNYGNADNTTAANPLLAVASYQLAKGSSGWSGLRTPDTFKTASVTASGNTAIWTPTNSKKFRLMGYQIETTENASLSAGAVLTLQFYDANVPIPIAHSDFVPTTAVTTVTGNGLETGYVSLGNGILSAAANNVLSLNLTATLATGVARVNVMGTEE